ncbi:ABC transporter permease [Phenylobacterium sp.]|uniref:ABC transporter permease n=1 Tax=Phenylobacterium sp. TaxID=1871053 RepID=UPI0027202929|nr:ABC transporter permease [Phenylobacterium sp.]MDO8380730.1 ABC transporter permease [Phenylobacterium sp.]
MQTSEHMLRTGRHGTLHEFGMAFADLKASTKRIDLAWSLAWHDIVSRYRGSILGPFWITLSMGLMVLGMGFLYAEIFKVPIQEYMPFVALGIVFWGVIVGVVTEGCDTFVHASGMLSQTSLPMFTFVWRTVLRNLITLAHHLVIVVVVLIWFGYWKVANLPMAVLGLALLMLNVSWVSMAVGIASARFRDVPQIVGSIMQFAMFMTPIFWQPGRMSGGRAHALLVLNPFFHMIDGIRTPLMGGQSGSGTYPILALLAVLGWAGAFTAFALTRRRIVHYL